MFSLITVYYQIPIFGPLFFITLILLYLMEVFLFVRDLKLNTELDFNSRNIIYLFFVIGIIIGLASSNSLFLSWSDNIFFRLIIGLFFIWVGMIIRISAILSLGTFFHTIIFFQKEQKILESGLYHYIRHPSYLGAFILMFGIAILFGNWVGFCGLVAFVSLGLFWRMEIEERYLISRFGEDYCLYMKRTSRLIPKIY